MRRREARGVGQIEVGGNMNAGPALEQDVLHRIAVALPDGNRARVQRTPLGREAAHGVNHAAAQILSVLLEFLARFHPPPGCITCGIRPLDLRQHRTPRRPSRVRAQDGFRQFRGNPVGVSCGARERLGRQLCADLVEGGAHLGLRTPCRAFALGTDDATVARHDVAFELPPAACVEYVPPHAGVDHLPLEVDASLRHAHLGGLRRLAVEDAPKFGEVERRKVVAHALHRLGTSPCSVDLRLVRDRLRHGVLHHVRERGRRAVPTERRTALAAHHVVAVLENGILRVHHHDSGPHAPAAHLRDVGVVHANRRREQDALSHLHAPARQIRKRPRHDAPAEGVSHDHEFGAEGGVGRDDFVGETLCGDVRVRRGG